MRRLGLLVAMLGLRQQAALFAGAVLVVLLTGLAFLGVQATRQASDRALEERLTTAQALAAAADHELEEISRQLRLAAAGTPLDFQDGDPGPEREVTARAYQQLAHLSPGVALLDGQGVLREEEA